MSLIKEADFGTPASPLKETVSIEIDGLPATATAGVSIMRAARESGIDDGDRVSLTSRKGEITLSAKITERVQPGVVYTTFHDPETGANVVTTEFSDWATDCPEYKVTAVQVAPAQHRSKWQHKFEERAKVQGKILETS